MVFIRVGYENSFQCAYTLILQVRKDLILPDGRPACAPAIDQKGTAVVRLYKNAVALADIQAGDGQSGMHSY